MHPTHLPLTRVDVGGDPRSAARCGAVGWTAGAVALVLACAAPVHAQQGTAAQTLAPAADRAASAPAAARVQVSGFQVSGNTLLSPGLIDATLDAFKGERSFDELQAAAAAVQRLYAQQGWGAVVAFLPPQTPQAGVVQISVVEGKLKQVDVKGAAQTGEAAVRASLPGLAVGGTPHMRSIDLQLQMANENPGRSTTVLLQPGAQTGEVDAAVTVTESTLQRWTLGLDNTGTPATGRTRASLAWQHASLTGNDDLLSLQAMTSLEEPSLVRVFSAGYRWPVYAWLTTFDAYASYSDVDGGSTTTAVGNLTFNGRGRLVGVRATRLLPRWGEVDQRVVLGVDQRDYLNQCAISGLPAGACGPAGESVTVQPVALEYTARAGGEVPWGLGIGLHHNLRWGGARTADADFQAVRPGAEPRYTALRLNASAATAVFEDWQLQARMAMQWSGDALVPAEQFGIGGAGTVRGYEERELTGDRGGFMSLEITTPSLGGDTVPGLHLSAFADAGKVETLEGALCAAGRSGCDLASVGLGARVGTPQTQLRLNAGVALRDGARTEKNKARLHAAFSHQF